MVTAGQIGWGTYREFEGPYFPGSVKLPEATPDSGRSEKIINVITATEGGSPNAVNDYDSCIHTLGVIQWCDKGMFGVTNMLGQAADDGVDISALTEFFKPRAEFVKLPGANGGSTWRWKFKDGRVVDSAAEQQELYHLGCNGLKGMWSPAQKSYARSFAAAAATVFESEESIQSQLRYTGLRLHMFLTTTARKLLLQPGERESNVRDAAIAAFYSFSANLPAVAEKQMQKLASKPVDIHSEEWLAEMLRTLTFGPGIAIYPGRYNKIRPVIERLYGVDLPDMAEELRKLPPPVVTSSGLDLSTPQGLQAALIRVGYDLGPAGADGVIGRKTQAAIRLFQSAHGLEVDGIAGKLTQGKLAELL